jgi:uncharacterized protein YkwD
MLARERPHVLRGVMRACTECPRITSFFSPPLAATKPYEDKSTKFLITHAYICVLGATLQARGISQAMGIQKKRAFAVKKIYGGLFCLSLMFLLTACGSLASTQPLASNSIALGQRDAQQSYYPTPIATPALSIPRQKVILTPTPPPAQSPAPAAPVSSSPPSSSSHSCVTFSTDTTLVPANNGSGLAAPYGSAPVSQEAQQLTQQLFQLVNSDREACGLPAFTWNATLASGALLHSWNMEHCGLSHTCPDGSTQYQRIANEGFAGMSDCGENIADAGPYPTPWAGVTTVQEGMVNEPVTGWHRIHLFSTTLHQIGIGVYVDSSGTIWFTEDMVS